MRYVPPTWTRRRGGENCRARVPIDSRVPRPRLRSIWCVPTKNFRERISSPPIPWLPSVDEASQCLRLLSGRNHRVHTAICLVTPKEAYRQRLVETRVRFKRLSEDDIETYLASGEWRGKAGGYAAQGIAGSFIVKIVGSYSNVVGLPLYEVTTLLSGEGYPIRAGWLNAV